jgi:hypothetical protein
MMVVACLVTVAATILVPGVTLAQPTTCPAPGDDVATVEIATPEPGAAVGGRVEVKGRVAGPTLLFQIELFVGDSRKDFVVLDPPVESADFDLVWDASAARGGPTTLHVVACGGTSEFGRLIRGTASVEVQVAGAAEPPATRVLVESESDEPRAEPSLAAGAVIAVPAVAGLLYAMGRARRRPSGDPSGDPSRDPS